MPETDVTFFNRQGLKLAGVLNLSAAAKATAPGPAVPLCQGLSGLKHLVLPEIAANFASQGLASLRLDYTGYGDSEGERAGSTHLRGSTARLRLSLGSDGTRVSTPVALALTATAMEARWDHSRVSGAERACGVSVSGPGDGAAMLASGRTAWDWIAFKGRIEKERATVAMTGPSTFVDIGKSCRSAGRFWPFTRSSRPRRGARARWRPAPTPALTGSSLPASTPCSTYTLKPPVGWGAGRLLIVHGEDDVVATIESVEPIYANAPGPKRWVIVPGAAHNDLDWGPGLVHAIGLASDWFAVHLARA